MSEASAIIWRRTSPWDAVARPGRGGATDGSAGVTIELVAEQRLSTLILREGQGDAFERFATERLGCAVPAPGRWSAGRACDLVWSAPGQWLAIWHAAPSLDGLGDLVAVTDQSDSRALVRVSGPKARDALARGFAIDLHPSAFASGAAAFTNVAHMSVQIWQLDDSPRYTIAIPRSFTGSFWSWLEASAAAFGYEIKDAA